MQAREHAGSDWSGFLRSLPDWPDEPAPFAPVFTRMCDFVGVPVEGAGPDEEEDADLHLSSDDSN